MNPSNGDRVSSTTADNTDASAPKRSRAATNAAPRMNAAAIAMTSGARIISKVLPKYLSTTTKQEGRALPPKKRKLPMNRNNPNSAAAPTTILLRQVASCWHPPTIASRDSFPTSGSPFYLERYCEKAVETVYPQGPQNLFRHVIEPCADPADLQRRHDKAAKKATAADDADKTIAIKHSTVASSKNKCATGENPTRKDKPTKHSGDEKDKLVASRQYAILPPSPSTATVVPYQAHGKSISTTVSTTKQMTSATKGLDRETSPLKRKIPRNNAGTPVVDTLPPIAGKKSPNVPSSKDIHQSVTAATKTPVRHRQKLPANVGDVPAVAVVTAGT